MLAASLERHQPRLTGQSQHAMDFEGETFGAEADDIAVSASSSAETTATRADERAEHDRGAEHDEQTENGEADQQADLLMPRLV